MAGTHVSFELTESHIENARTYLPISVKAALSQTIAESCIEKIDGRDALPPMYRLDPLSRELLCAGVLLKYYLKVLDPDDSAGISLSTGDYDYYMSVVLKTPLMDDTARDFNHFTKMLDTCIESELSRKNDPCNRLTQMIMRQTTPEAMQSALKQFESIAGELKDFKMVSTLPDEEFKKAAGG